MLVSRMTLPRLAFAATLLFGVIAPFRADVRAATDPAADVFTVRNVEVDVTAASPTAGRDQAIRMAQREALARLFARLTPASAGRQPPGLDDAGIEQLVDAFEVEAERTSAVRYVGKFTVKFRPAAVRTLMLNNGIRYAEVRAKPVLVIPIDQTAGAPILWQQDTAWRQSWLHAEPTGGLVPVQVPYGEAQDVADLGVEQALSGDRDALRRIAARYGAGAVAVAVAQPGAGGRPGMVQVTVHRPEGGAPETFTVETGGAGADPYAPAVARIVSHVEQAWIAENLLDTAQQNSMAVAVAFESAEQWAETRRRLAAIPTVTRSRLVSLSRTGAELSIDHLGDVARLRTALAQRDLDLSESPSGGGPAWTLRLRAAAPAPAASQTAPIPQ